MGHNIEYFEYKESVSRAAVQTELDNYVKHATWQEGGHGTGGIRWNEYEVCKDYDQAVKWIESHDKHNYDYLAVRYFTPVNTPNNKKLEELQQAETAAMHKCEEKSRVIYPSTLTSELITCKHCGSKLARKYLHSNYCPVCRADLRPEYMLKTISAAQQKWNNAIQKLNEYKLKHSKKEIYWLVKIEYHT